jgi:hypothetical protein
VSYKKVVKSREFKRRGRVKVKEGLEERKRGWRRGEREKGGWGRREEGGGRREEGKKVRK